MSLTVFQADISEVWKILPSNLKALHNFQISKALKYQLLQSGTHSQGRLEISAEMWPDIQAHQPQSLSQMTAPFNLAKWFPLNRFLLDPHADINTSPTPDTEAAAYAKTSGNTQACTTYRNKAQRAHWKQNKSPLI